eukprot:817426-Alexandrium_andersonii.AAC.2
MVEWMAAFFRSRWWSGWLRVFEIDGGVDGCAFDKLPGFETEGCFRPCGQQPRYAMLQQVLVCVLCPGRSKESSAVHVWLH